METDNSQLAGYTNKQVDAYLERLGIANIPRDTTLATLEKVVRRQLITFPFENSEMHYTPHGHVVISLEAVYDRHVIRGQGSHCFSTHTLLQGMLKALGFSVAVGVGRLNSLAMKPGNQIELRTISHMILFVRVTDTDVTYLVDNGMGNNSPVHPVPLQEGVVCRGAIASEGHRVVRMSHPDASPGFDYQPGWALQMMLPGQDAGWTTLYQFDMQQYYHQDMEALALLVEKSGKAFVARHLFAVSFEEVEGGDLAKNILFGKQVRRDTSDGERVLREFTSENDRISAFREIFGVHLKDDAASYVRPEIKMTF